MKVVITMLFGYFYICLPSTAQHLTAVPLIGELNKRISSIENGYFECKVTSKSMTKEDTTIKFGRTYFFHNLSDTDSIGQFLVELPDKYRNGYDGELFYSVDDGKRSIRTEQITSNKGVRKLLGAGTLHRIAFRSYLFGDKKPPFWPEDFKLASVDTFVNEGKTILLITLRDTFPNPLKTLEKDPENSCSKIELEVELPDYYLKSKREWYEINGMTQYIRQDLSRIYPLDKSITFESLLNVDSLLRSGYILKATQKTERPKLITPGETVHKFTLRDLDGNIVSSEDLSQKLILLDFWYKGCAPCLLSMPIIEKLHKKYLNSGLGVYGINVQDKDPAQIINLLVNREITYTTLLDSDKVFAKSLNVSGYPTIILFDKVSGKVLFSQAGLNDSEDILLSRLIEANLK